jgi:hypothetical protein
MGCFCGVYLSWIVNRAIQNHGLRVDLSIDPPCYDVDDPSLGVMTDVSLYLHMNDRLGDLNLDDDHHDDLVDHRMNVKDDRNLGVSRVNRSCAPHDLKMGGTTDVSRGHRMSDRLDDQNLDVSRVIRNCVRRDLMTDGNLDVNRDHHMNVMDDRNDLKMVVNLLNRNCAHRDLNLVVMMDVNLCLRMNDLLGDLSLDASHVNRNYVRRDLMMV